MAHDAFYTIAGFPKLTSSKQLLRYSEAEIYFDQLIDFSKSLGDFVVVLEILIEPVSNSKHSVTLHFGENSAAI